MDFQDQFADIKDKTVSIKIGLTMTTEKDISMQGLPSPIP